MLGNTAVKRKSEEIRAEFQPPHHGGTWELRGKDADERRLTPEEPPRRDQR